MKKFIVALLAVASVSAYAWRCEATSPSAIGVGYSPYLNVAQDIAMNECQMRTPYYQACFLRSCF